MSFGFRPAILLAVASLAACNARHLCSLELRHSVLVRTVDPEGQPVPDAVVSFAATGESFEPCQTQGAEAACGREQDGSIAIRVDAPGFEPFETTVVVRADECHVTTESVDVVLERP